MLDSGESAKEGRQKEKAGTGEAKEGWERLGSTDVEAGTRHEERA